jgi:hypothetical protein
VTFKKEKGSGAIPFGTVGALCFGRNPNGQIRWMNKRAEPSLPTLMEDFYARGDRQRLFFAKVDTDRP